MTGDSTSESPYQSSAGAKLTAANEFDEESTENNDPIFSGLALLQEGRNFGGLRQTVEAPDAMPRFDQPPNKVGNPAEELFSAEKISKIMKISVTKEGIKTGDAVKLKEGEPLPKGDYKIFWKIGKDPKSGESIERAALLHIPEGKDLGLLVLVPGVSNKDQLSENYLMETHFHELADEGKEKYAVLTLLTEKREIGPESKAKGIKSSAWVADGCFLKPEVVAELRKENKERTGIAYDDRHYVAGVLATCAELAPVDKDPRARAFVGGSQGGDLITRLCGDDRFHDMANVYIIGSSAEANASEIHLPPDGYVVDPYKINDDNAQHVLIFQHRDDTIALPHPDKLALIKASLNIPFLHRKVVDLGLGAFDNLHQNPLKLEAIYLRDLDRTIGRNIGDSDRYTMKAYTPTDGLAKFKTRESFNRELKQTEIEQARKENKDLLYRYILKRGDGKDIIVDIYDLPANHVIAGRADGSTSMYKKYDGVDESIIIDKDIEELLAKRKLKTKQ